MCPPTRKDVNVDGPGFSVGRATDVRPGIGRLAASNDQHADQYSRFYLFRDDDAAVGVGWHLLVVLVPVHVVWRFRTSGSVACQLDRTVRFHVFGSKHLDCCNTERTLSTVDVGLNSVYLCFYPNVTIYVRYVRVFVIANPSVVCLSPVTFVRPTPRGLKLSAIFLSCFYLGHPLTSV